MKTLAGLLILLSLTLLPTVRPVLSPIVVPIIVPADYRASHVMERNVPRLGLILPFLFYGIASSIDPALATLLSGALPLVVPVAAVVYYLVWKHLVAFLIQLLGISA